MSDKVASHYADDGDLVSRIADSLPFADAAFDAAMTIHVAMNIATKDRMYAEAKRVLKLSGRFAVYDVLQGEGGEVLFPVPWAREPSISHLATPDDMEVLLAGAGFRILDVNDSTEESQQWFEAMSARIAQTAPPSRSRRSSAKILR
ncbi:methyltransferase domain-containing protein [Elioraea sp.]|uniref:methyltransferase domain-containing protein n=1 Tax=Elioraea sp. TaxID=2185103 RepID=UPI003F6F1ACB